MKLVKIAMAMSVLMLTIAVPVLPALAQPGQQDGETADAVDGEQAAEAADANGQWALIEFSSAFGAGLVCVGSAYGIGKLATSALESMARQPEVAGSIQTAMIIAAALIEGFTFYALFICSQAG